MQKSGETTGRRARLSLTPLTNGLFIVCAISSPAGDTHHGVQQGERRQIEEGLSRLLSHGLVHVVQLVYDVVA